MREILSGCLLLTVWYIGLLPTVLMSYAGLDISSGYSHNKAFTDPVDSTTALKSYELFAVADSIIENKGYKAAVDYIRSFEKSYTDPTEVSIYRQIMATYTSAQGNTAEALKYEALYAPGIEEEPFTFVDEFEVKSARETIVERCRDKQVVMFNEAHHRGQHRVFIRSVLRDMYDLGFRHFLVEGYMPDEDSLLNRRGYPILKTGTYIREPAFGQLIREAQEIGFAVAAYDRDTSECNSPEPFVCANQREKVAAENIYEVLRKDPKAKILVAAGYDHILKKSEDGWIKMAEQFRQMSGINPYSIDIVSMSERSSPKFENRFYKAAMKQFTISAPSVILRKLNGRSFLRLYSPDQVDLQVVLPRTKYIYGYSDWLTDDYEKKHVIDLSKVSCVKGDLFQVYVKKEWEEQGIGAVPFLQFPLVRIDKQTVFLPDNQKFVVHIDKGDSQEMVEVNL